MCHLPLGLGHLMAEMRCADIPVYCDWLGRLRGGERGSKELSSKLRFWIWLLQVSGSVLLAVGSLHAILL